MEPLSLQMKVPLNSSKINHPNIPAGICVINKVMFPNVPMKVIIYPRFIHKCGCHFQQVKDEIMEEFQVGETVVNINWYNKRLDVIKNIDKKGIIELSNGNKYKPNGHSVNKRRGDMLTDNIRKASPEEIETLKQKSIFLKNRNALIEDLTVILHILQRSSGENVIPINSIQENVSFKVGYENLQDIKNLDAMLKEYIQKFTQPTPTNEE